MQPTQSVTFYVVEESTAILKAAFFDENGSAVSASALVWQLTDEDGNIINGRDDVPIPGTASAVVIVIGNLDTKRSSDEAYVQGAIYLRVLRLAGAYDSVNGSGLPLVQSYTFGIVPVPADSDAGGGDD